MVMYSARDIPDSYWYLRLFSLYPGYADCSWPVKETIWNSLAILDIQDHTTWAETMTTRELCNALAISYTKALMYLIQKKGGISMPCAIIRSIPLFSAHNLKLYETACRKRAMIRTLLAAVIDDILLFVKSEDAEMDNDIVMFLCSKLQTLKQNMYLENW